MGEDWTLLYTPIAILCKKENISQGSFFAIFAERAVF
jgi:hypothetical protein